MGILLGLIFPFLEIYLLILVIRSIGFFPVLTLIILTALWGLQLVKSQGFKTLTGIQNRIAEGQDPQMDLLNGAAVLIGGMLLIFPGILTDIMGLICIFPPTRTVLKLLIKKWTLKKVFKNRKYQSYSTDSNGPGRTIKDINLPPES